MVGTVDRAYALLEVKSFDVARRTFAGIATTPTPDRSGDVLEPLGVTFKNPLPLLLHHDKTKPVGTVRFDPPTKAGVTFEASIPDVLEAGALKDRLDEAWQSVKAGLIGGVSVGYRVLQGGLEKIKGSAGYRLLRTEVCELSLVTVPANAEATILSIKALDAPFLAASGHPRSGDADLPVVSLKASPMPKTILERIADLESARKIKVDRIAELLTKSSDADETLSPEDATEHDRLALEVKALDAEITRNTNLEALQVKTATPLVPSTSTKDADLRGGGHVVQVKSNLPPGTGFTRYAMALLANKGSRSDAIHYAEERWKDSSPRGHPRTQGCRAAGDDDRRGVGEATRPRADPDEGVHRPAAAGHVARPHSEPSQSAV